MEKGKQELCKPLFYDDWFDYSILVGVTGIINLFTSKRKIKKVLEKYNIKKYYISRFFYTLIKAEKGYNKQKSRYIEISGVDFDTVVKIAEEICIVFKQEHVLIRENIIGRRICLVNSKNEKEIE
jgi:hypothetical protein